MSMMAISPTAMLDPETIRWNFPILGKPLHDLQHHGERLVYLDNASTTQPPWQVPQAMLEVYARHYSNVHRGTFCSPSGRPSGMKSPGNRSVCSSTPPAPRR